MVHELNNMIATNKDWNVWRKIAEIEDINFPQRLCLLLLEISHLINNMWTALSNEQLPNEHNWQSNVWGPVSSSTYFIGA